MTRFNGWLVVGAAAAMLALGGCSGDGTDGASADDPPGVDATTGDTTAPDDGTTDDVAFEGQPIPGGPDAPARPSPGCERAGATVERDAERVDLSVHGESRYYLITSPRAEAGEPLPLVVDLHGLMEGAQIHALHSGLGEFGQEHGFVTAFPHGRGEPVSWDTTTGSAENADLDYVDEILDSIGATQCIDEARVYAIGLSNGAMMATTLACERSDRFAAVSPVDGIQAPEPCEQPRPVPIVTTHGTADPILLFNGGVGDLTTFLGDDEGRTAPATSTTLPVDLHGEGYPATVAGWAERHGCDPDPEDERIGESVIHRAYDCPRGADVEFYIVEGGGHTWPGSEFSTNIESITGPTTFEIDWNEVAWDFFQRFSLL